MRNYRLGQWLFRGVVATLFVLLVLPLGIVVATAFDASSVVVFPPTALSTRWFEELLNSPTWLRSLINSIIVAAGTTIVSLVVGVTAALGLRGYDGRFATALTGLAVLPLLVPGVIIGVTLLTFFSRFGLQEFVMALFLSGPDTRTVPVKAWNSLRQSLDPLVSVVSTVLLVAVIMLVLLAGALVGLDRFATDT